MKNKLIPVGSVAAILFSASLSNAFVLVDFKPVPTTPNLSEFDLTPGGAGGLFNGAGTVFGGPGGGLLVETPFTVAAPIPGKVITSAGTTQFDDASLYFTSANGVASTVFDPFIGSIAYQILITGHFEIYALTVGNTLRAPGPGAILLLSGDLGQASITGQQLGTTASVRDNFITYTGGVIFDQLKAFDGLPNATALPGTMSISLNDLSSPFTPNSPFTSNATGLFSTPVIPEPGMATIFGGAMLGLSLRRRNRKLA